MNEGRRRPFDLDPILSVRFRLVRQRAEEHALLWFERYMRDLEREWVEITGRTTSTVEWGWLAELVAWYGYDRVQVALHDVAVAGGYRSASPPDYDELGAVRILGIDFTKVEAILDRGWQSDASLAADTTTGGI